MSRRAGKAANRRSRQRKVQRPLGAPAPTVETPPAEAVEAVAVPSAASRPASRAVPSAVGSQLTATERSEYHYVERDLRDIGILTVVMAALLLLSWIVFGALGLSG